MVIQNVNTKQKKYLGLFDLQPLPFLKIKNLKNEFIIIVGEGNIKKEKREKREKGRKEGKPRVLSSHSQPKQSKERNHNEGDKQA